MNYEDLKARLEPLRTLELSDADHRQMRAALHRAMATSSGRTQSWRGEGRRKYRKVALVAGVAALLVAGGGFAMETYLPHHPASVTANKTLPEPDMSKAVNIPWMAMSPNLQVTAKAVASIYGSPDTPEDTFENVNLVTQRTIGLNDPSAVIYVISFPGSFAEKVPNGTGSLRASKLVFNMSADGKNVWNLRAIDSSTGKVVWTQPHFDVEHVHFIFSGQSEHWTGYYEGASAKAWVSKGDYEHYGTDSEGDGVLRFRGNPASVHGPIDYQVRSVDGGEGGRMELSPTGVVHLNYAFSDPSQGIQVIVKWNGQKEQFTMNPK